MHQSAHPHTHAVDVDVIKETCRRPSTSNKRFWQFTAAHVDSWVGGWSLWLCIKLLSAYTASMLNEQQGGKHNSSCGCTDRRVRAAAHCTRHRHDWAEQSRAGEDKAILGSRGDGDVIIKRTCRFLCLIFMISCSNVGGPDAGLFTS